MSATERTKPNTPVTSHAETELKRDALGTGGITFMVVSAAAPLTVIAGVAPLAILRGGIGAPVGYLAAGATLGVFAIGFLTMSRHVPGASSFYSYITHGLGRTVGLASGMSAVVAYNALQIGVYGLFAAQTQATLHDLLGWNVPWPVIAVFSVVAVWLLGYRGIDVGAKVLGVLLFAETGILVVLAVAVLAQGGAHGLSAEPFAPHAVFTPGMAGVLTICFAAYMGFESTVLYRQEARDPRRTIPRATYIAVGFLAVLYAFIVWAVIQAFGDVVAAAREHTADLFFVAANEYLGAWSGGLMHVLIITSVYAAQLAFHNAANRYVYSLSRDGVLPSSLGVLHPRYRSPYRAGRLQSGLALGCILVFAVMGADPYLQLLPWVNTPGVVGVLGLQVLVSVSVVAFFVRRGMVRRVPIAIIAAALATVLLTAALVLVVVNIDVLLMAPPLIKTVVLSVMPTTFVLGLVIAAVLRVRRPDRYSTIGYGAPSSNNTDELR